MSVAVAGSPPAATIKSSAASPWDFASFSPGAGKSYLVGVTVMGDQSVAADVNISWLSGGSGVWQKLDSYTVGIFWPTDFFFYVHCTSAPGPSVIRLTGTHVASVTFAYILELTGDDPASPLGQVAHISGALQGSITPLKTGSMIFGVMNDQNEPYTPTANGQTTVVDTYNWGGAEATGVRSTGNTTSGSAVTIGCTNTVSANYLQLIEIQPLAGSSLTFGQPSEIDTAQPLVPSKTRTEGQPVETDLAQPLSFTKAGAIGLPVETDSALTIVRSKTRTLGLPVDTSSTFTLARSKQGTLGQPLEVDEALQLVRSNMADTHQYTASLGGDPWIGALGSDRWSAGVDLARFSATLGDQ